MAAPCPGMQKKAHPLQPPAPRGQGVQGVSNGKVTIVAHTQVGPDIKFFPLGSPNKFGVGADFALVLVNPPVRLDESQDVK